MEITYHQMSNEATDEANSHRNWLPQLELAKLTCGKLLYLQKQNLRSKMKPGSCTA